MKQEQSLCLKAVVKSDYVCPSCSYHVGKSPILRLEKAFNSCHTVRIYASGHGFVSLRNTDQGEENSRLTQDNCRLFLVEIVRGRQLRVNHEDAMVFRGTIFTDGVGSLR